MTAGLIQAPIDSRIQARIRYGEHMESTAELILAKEWIVKTEFLGKPLYVNKDIVLPLKFIEVELKLKGLHSEVIRFQGCYNPRFINDKPAKPSTHSYGLSCDFNHTVFSREFVEIWKRYGFSWGGDWCSFKDWMHFSYAKYERGNCEYYKEDK
jgi:hypothetical protein